MNQSVLNLTLLEDHKESLIQEEVPKRDSNMILGQLDHNFYLNTDKVVKPKFSMVWKTSTKLIIN